ncbi:MAG: membrane protein insertion efficiency factor YidD [Archangium sp.]|nr:membrane protein insertion efficiency factor YidD [Archangium sp.]
MLAFVTAAVVAQSPGPWSAPLAPAFDLESPVPVSEPMARPSLSQTIARGVYLAYRATLSSAKGPNCAFSPSCSLYGHQAIERVGLGLGLVLFGARLMRGHLNVDRFYRFEGVHLVDPLDATLSWLWPDQVAP